MKHFKGIIPLLLILFIFVIGCAQTKKIESVEAPFLLKTIQIEENSGEQQPNTDISKLQQVESSSIEAKEIPEEIVKSLVGEESKNTALAPTKIPEIASVEPPSVSEKYQFDSQHSSAENERDIEENIPTNKKSAITPIDGPSIAPTPEREIPRDTTEFVERLPMSMLLFFISIILILIIFLFTFFLKLRRKEAELLIKSERIVTTEGELKIAEARVAALHISDIESAIKMLRELERKTHGIESELITLEGQRMELKEKKGVLKSECENLESRVEKQKLKLSRSRELYKAIESSVEHFRNTEIPSIYFRPLTAEEKIDLESIAPSVMLNLNYMNYQELQKEFRANQKQIDTLLEDYAQRYTTKANQSIYKLMVISLRSELQNILYNLKFEKLQNALVQVQSLVAKYLVIVSEGNQQIAVTIRKFVGELEHLFENAVKIEYEYYIKKEQAKQEQLALRQQMREEVEERRRLEEQKRKIAIEESKYQAEIDKVQQLLHQEPEDSPRKAEIEAKLLELTSQLEQVEEQKEAVAKLQNGKAGNVYIISNLGSFGDQVFKIGMTRRIDPQERVDELGSASVPFKYDVHSFIFSEDAVGLENEIHRRLHTRRVNKVNLRKEFFDITLNELEQMVMEINPTAEFNRTMMAEDYKQSLSLGDQELPLANFEETTLEDEDVLENGEDE